MVDLTQPGRCRQRLPRPTWAPSFFSVDGAPAVGPFPTSSPATTRLAPLALTGRFLQFDVADSTGGNLGALEIRVFAPPG